jgi:hypothetical protein
VHQPSLLIALQPASRATALPSPPSPLTAHACLARSLRPPSPSHPKPRPTHPRTRHLRWARCWQTPRRRSPRRSLYDSTFSRTVCRLSSGAKGLVMWYYGGEARRRRRRVLLRPRARAAPAPAAVCHSAAPRGHRLGRRVHCEKKRHVKLIANPSGAELCPRPAMQSRGAAAALIPPPPRAWQVSTGWVVEASTLPWAEGRPLHLAATPDDWERVPAPTGPTADRVPRRFRKHEDCAASHGRK